MHKQAATSGKAESAAAKHRSMPTIGVDVPAAIATCAPMAAAESTTTAGRLCTDAAFDRGLDVGL